MKRIALTFAILFLSGCVGPELHLYDGPKREDHEVATIDPGWGCYGCVTEIKRFDQPYPIYTPSQKIPNKITVLPGKYMVTLRHRARKSTTARWKGYVDLQPGHTYHVLRDVCFGFCFTVPSYTTFVWMEDADTGEVLLGTKM